MKRRAKSFTENVRFWFEKGWFEIDFLAREVSPFSNPDIRLSFQYNYGFSASGQSQTRFWQPGQPVPYFS